jgi:hypothetical protein
MNMSELTTGLVNIVLWIMIIVAILDGSLHPSLLVLVLESIALVIMIVGLISAFWII